MENSKGWTHESARGCLHWNRVQVLPFTTNLQSPLRSDNARHFLIGSSIWKRLLCNSTADFKSRFFLIFCHLVMGNRSVVVEPSFRFSCQHQWQKKWHQNVSCEKYSVAVKNIRTAINGFLTTKDPSLKQGSVFWIGKAEIEINPSRYASQEKIKEILGQKNYFGMLHDLFESEHKQRKSCAEPAVQHSSADEDNNTHTMMQQCWEVILIPSCSVLLSPVAAELSSFCSGVLCSHFQCFQSFNGDFRYSRFVLPSSTFSTICNFVLW